jgi:hypothetical protein
VCSKAHNSTKWGQRQKIRGTPWSKRACGQGYGDGRTLKKSGDHARHTKSKKAALARAKAMGTLQMCLRARLLIRALPEPVARSRPPTALPTRPTFPPDQPARPPAHPLTPAHDLCCFVPNRASNLSTYATGASSPAACSGATANHGRAAPAVRGEPRTPGYGPPD